MGSVRPQSSPASLPTLSGFETPTPTSSNAGWPSRISAITIEPTTPVPQRTTRFFSVTQSTYRSKAASTCCSLSP